jgi:MFS superfamily sulfate permease-like transporter
LDSIVWLVTFLGCTLISFDAGLGLGVSLGLLFMFCRVAFPRIAHMRPLPGTAAYRDAGLYGLQVLHPWNLTLKCSLVMCTSPV